MHRDRCIPQNRAAIAAVVLGSLVASSTFAPAARADIPPDYDFQWASIGDVNNPAYPGGPPFNGNAGRGSVAYSYRISKLEITTQQWADFLNMALRDGVDLNIQQLRPAFWGASQSGGKYVVGDAMRPVIGLNWRAGAYYCNWLNNGKAEGWSNALTGAYDASTFATLADGTYTDQLTHSPGAKFWIPTLDEWLKAAHYDPAHDGPGQGGWWSYPYRSESAPVPGAPGEAETTAGWNPPDFAELLVPLGAYTNQISAYGLWDLSGGAEEWLEEPAGAKNGRFQYRRADGAFAGELSVGRDHVQSTGFDIPGTIGGYYGFRIAGTIPSPSVAIALGLGVFHMTQRRRGCHGSM